MDVCFKKYFSFPPIFSSIFGYFLGILPDFFLPYETGLNQLPSNREICLGKCEIFVEQV